MSPVAEYPQVGISPGQYLDRRPTFQAGHAGSIPVACLRTTARLGVLAEIRRLTVSAYDLGKGSWLNV